MTKGQINLGEMKFKNILKLLKLKMSLSQTIEGVKVKSSAYIMIINFSLAKYNLQSSRSLYMQMGISFKW